MCRFAFKSDYNMTFFDTKGQTVNESTSSWDEPRTDLMFFIQFQIICRKKLEFVTAEFMTLKNNIENRGLWFQETPKEIKTLLKIVCNSKVKSFLRIAHDKPLSNASSISIYDADLNPRIKKFYHCADGLYVSMYKYFKRFSRSW